MLTDIVFRLLFRLISAYSWALIAAAIISTLLALNVLDTRNRVIWSIADFLNRITEPALRPIRRVLPVMGGIDFSPWVALVLLRLVVSPILQGIYVGLRTGVWQPLF